MRADWDSDKLQISYAIKPLDQDHNLNVNATLNVENLNFQFQIMSELEEQNLSDIEEKLNKVPNSKSADDRLN